MSIFKDIIIEQIYNKKLPKKMENAHLFTLLVLLFNIQGALCDQALFHGDLTFQEFCSQFNKNYEGEEVLKRKQQFQQTRSYILEQRQNGQIIKFNKFADMFPSERQSFLTYKPEPQKSKQKPQLKRAPLQAYALPQTYDYRDFGKVTSIKDQGICGSCWAFTTAGQYESQLLLFDNIYTDLSQQYILQCTQGSTCSGGWPHDAFQVIRDTGIPIQGNYPYKVNESYYPSSICTANNATYRKLSQQITSIDYYYKQFTDVKELKQAIWDWGPTTVGVYASDNIFYYAPASGYIQTCSTNFVTVNHAVLVIGWTATHWIIKNEWGTTWGDDGYAYIPFTNDCGILGDVWVVQLETPYFHDEYKTVENPFQIIMEDSAGDGWNGNVFGLVQGDTLKATFGSGFTSGTYSKIQVSDIGQDKTVSIVVTQRGSKLSQVKFTIRQKYTNRIIYTHNQGSNTFPQNNVLGSFCSGYQCDQSTYAILHDTYGDGWSGFVLEINQAGQSFSMGEQFRSKKRFGPVAYSLQPIPTTVKVKVRGSWSQEIGFQIRDSNGRLLAQRKTGTSFNQGDTLASFVPSLGVASSWVATDASGNYDSSTYQSETIVPESNQHTPNSDQQNNIIQDQNQAEQTQTNESTESSGINIAIIGAIAGGAFVLVTAVIVFCCIRRRRNKQSGSDSGLTATDSANAIQTQKEDMTAKNMLPPPQKSQKWVPNNPKSHNLFHQAPLKEEKIPYDQQLTKKENDTKPAPKKTVDNNSTKNTTKPIENRKTPAQKIKNEKNVPTQHKNIKKIEQKLKEKTLSKDESKNSKSTQAKSNVLKKQKLKETQSNQKVKSKKQVPKPQQANQLPDEILNHPYFAKNRNK